jgi:hypothetical protein
MSYREKLAKVFYSDLMQIRAAQNIRIVSSKMENFKEVTL